MTIGMLVILGLLVVFMIFNSRSRMKKMKAEQEEKASQMLPGVEVMLQGGLYGTIVSYNANDLNEPAELEIAPGTVIKVHSQAIARIVTPSEVDEPEYGSDAPDIETIHPDDAPRTDETIEETRRRLEGDK